MMITRAYRLGSWWVKVYDAILPFLVLVAYAVSAINVKLRKALSGRRGGVNRWRFTSDSDRPVLLIHTASRGEYEAVLPLIYRLINDGRFQIAVSYSSPSLVDTISLQDSLWASGFHPVDFLSSQLRLIAKLEPSLVLISKHDLWPNFLRACQALQVPVLLINAHFSQKGWRKFPVILAFRKSLLKMVSEVWTVSPEDAELVKRWTKDSVLSLVIGDMRYDRVLLRAQIGQERFRYLKNVLGRGLIGVLGSSWEKEERLVRQAWKRMNSSSTPLRLIIVPHEWNEKRMMTIEREFKDDGAQVVRFSQWIEHPSEIDVLLVDKMGILSEIYALGDWALIGGGFGRGVHSVIEPAAHGIPVLFGPHHEVSYESTLLIQEGGGIEIRTHNDLIAVWERWLNDPSLLKESGQKALKVVQERAGATEIAFQRILERLR